MLRIAMEGLTQEQLETASGVNQANISKLLLGKSEPKLSTLDKLERALPKLRELRNAQHSQQSAVA